MTKFLHIFLILALSLGTSAMLLTGTSDGQDGSRGLGVMAIEFATVAAVLVKVEHGRTIASAS